MNNLYQLTQKILTAAGGAPSFGDSRSALLKKLLIAKGGTPAPMDSEPSLWRKIAARLGVTMDSGASTWDSLWRIVADARFSDSEWQLMNKLWRGGFIAEAVTPPAGPPDAPVIGASTDITDTTFEVNFTPVAGATSYRLDVSNGFAFDSYLVGFEDAVVAGELTQVLVTGATPDSIHSVRMRAVGPGGTSVDSDVVLVTTTA